MWVLSLPQVNLPSGVLLLLLLGIISALGQDQYSGFHSGQRSPSSSLQSVHEFTDCFSLTETEPVRAVFIWRGFEPGTSLPDARITAALLFVPPGDEQAYEDVSAPPGPGENRPVTKPAFCAFAQ